MSPRLLRVLMETLPGGDGDGGTRSRLGERAIIETCVGRCPKARVATLQGRVLA